MLIDAIYENGTIKPLIPLKLKKKKIRMEIIIPDNLIEMEQEQGPGSSMRGKIDAILGQYAHPRPAVTPAEDKAVWHKHLEEKYNS